MEHRGRVALLVLATGSTAMPAAAQTDYYNTDAHRPVRIEDAYAVERYAFELQLAPIRLDRSDEGIYRWALEPGVAYGILPRTHVEIALPVILAERGDGERSTGLGALELTVFHNLNVETAGLPAFGLAADVQVPVGGFAADRAYASATAIATRTFRFARFHLNAGYTFGSAPDLGESAGETSRWLAGLAVDRAFPLRAALLMADIYVEQPIHGRDSPALTVEAGGRYQLDPYFTLDAGIGRRLGGDERGWYVTFGAARVFALRSLMPAGEQ